MLAPLQHIDLIPYCEIGFYFVLCSWIGIWRIYHPLSRARDLKPVQFVVAHLKTLFSFMDNVHFKKPSETVT